MKSVEFDGTLAPNGQISIPADLARAVPQGEPLRVVLQWDVANDEDRAWRTQGLRRFEAAYSPEDVVYEQLIDETPKG